jgi:hypothetical protein
MALFGYPVAQENDSERRGHPAPPERACQADTYKVSRLYPPPMVKSAVVTSIGLWRGIVLRLVDPRENGPPL